VATTGAKLVGEVEAAVGSAEADHPTKPAAAAGQ
jgi:hypothetical protein